MASLRESEGGFFVFSNTSTCLYPFLPYTTGFILPLCRKSSIMFSRISAWILFDLWGWKVTGQYAYQIKKLILIVAPHTSNWDFPIGILVRSALKIDAYFVGKHTLFWGPLGPIMRWLRGIPVDRGKKSNFVLATADIFNHKESLHIVMAPEGTRAKVEKFRSGFYHIAKAAQVPVLLCTFDWEHKIIHFDPELFTPTADEAADMAFLWNYYKGIKGYHPEKGVQ
jgi:1-acyl-sn-glycerol-3-phosphate acyltransferase